MTADNASWTRQAFLWPLACGAMYGIYVALQFAAPGFLAVAVAIVLGVVVSLPFSAALGVVAVGAGATAVSALQRKNSCSSPQGRRTIFALSTAIPVGIVSTAALTLIDVSERNLAAESAAIAVVALIASWLYFPKDLSHRSE